MSTAYIHRHYIIVPISSRDTANTSAAAIDPDTGGADTFSVPLSGTGLGPVTHYGCNSAATEEMRAAMLSALSGVTASYWRTDAATGVLAGTNVAASLTKVGQPFTFDQALADVAIQRVSF